MISRHKPKPESGLCENCNKRQYRYLVNVTRKYTRVFTNWKYLCQRIKTVSGSATAPSTVTTSKVCYDVIGVIWNAGIKKGQDKNIDDFIAGCLK
jgi:hypothetical protein